MGSLPVRSSSKASKGIANTASRTVRSGRGRPKNPGNAGIQDSSFSETTPPSTDSALEKTAQPVTSMTLMTKMLRYFLKLERDGAFRVSERDTRTGIEAFERILGSLLVVLCDQIHVVPPADLTERGDDDGTPDPDVIRRRKALALVPDHGALAGQLLELLEAEQWSPALSQLAGALGYEVVRVPRN